MFIFCLTTSAYAQAFKISNVEVRGNIRIETATIESLLGLGEQSGLSAAELNDAIQDIRDSGLFESVLADVDDGSLIITVVENPTVNSVVFEGNNRLTDELLRPLVRTLPRRIYAISQVRDDANAIASAYADQGRISASVEPRIIRRSDNRVDVIFEIIEGGIVEIERISFVGNRSFSDRRLRRVIETKQAGLLRLLIRRDTFVKDRIEFDKQLLTDFYKQRGFVDFKILSVNSELSQTRDSFFVTFNIQEGQQFQFGKVDISTVLPGVNPADFEAALKVKKGQIYSPELVELTIARMERRALELGLDFVVVKPRESRNEKPLTMDLVLEMSQGPRIFIERINISGNTTTQDRVVRRQFQLVEGDPFNPRQIRRTADRIRKLNLFGSTGVTTRQGSAPNKIIIDVKVTEKPTGSLSFGANYNSADGVGLLANFKEANFLGRGQAVAFSFTTTSNTNNLDVSLTEPALLSRDLALNVGASYRTTTSNNALYDTESLDVAAQLTFPISENGRLGTKVFNESELIKNVTTGSTIIQNDATRPRRTNYGLGYAYSLDNRRTGLNPKAGSFLRFSQDMSLAGDENFVRSNLRMGAETYIGKDDVRLTAVLESGALAFQNNTSSRITDRFFMSARTFRGFAPGGIGPRQKGVGYDDALGGDYYAVARFETQFPIGLPNEYGIDFGAFLDVGSVWGLDPSISSSAGVLYDSFTTRAVVGVTMFWSTAIGPLRFNWTDAVKKEGFDVEQTFDLTISTSF
ncbi:outer membrane protein assembly factor BamA [bacterium]|nr:outer membrane protein assembly factor BamA [bacterium]